MVNVLLERLPDPKNVGAAEYTLIHDFISDLEAQGTAPLTIQASLDEVSRWARRALIEYTRVTNSY